MADQEPKDAEEKSNQVKPDAAANPKSRRALFHGWDDRIRRFLSFAGRSTSRLGFPAQVLFTVVAAILAAAILLWIVDKIVFYYLARSYVDEVADVFDLNVHLANALVLLTFLCAVFFARYIWSFSKQRRLVGIAGVSALLVGHSLVLWYGTRNEYFNRLGESIKCYVLSRDGKVTFGEHPGIDPATGRLCRPVTVEMLERLKEYQKGERPQPITDSNPTFFDPRTGEPIVWYYRSKDNKIELFDLMGFEPDTGEELLPVTKEVVGEWKIQKRENQALCVPKRVDPDNFVFFDPVKGEPRAWYWQDASGNYEFYNCSGFQPETGDKLQIATRDIVDAWKKNRNHENAPKLIDPNTYPFFDPRTGAAQVWYWRGDNGAYEFYNAPGFEPKTGDKLSIITRDIVEKWKQDNQKPKTSPSESNGPLVPNNIDLRQRTAAFLDVLYREESSPNNEALAAANSYYADQVTYYGKSYSRGQVMADLQGFYNRWPVRQYVIEQGSLKIDCEVQSLTCSAKGLLDFDARSPDRQQRSFGSASFDYVLNFASLTAQPLITQEEGEVKARNVEPFTYSAPPPSGYQTWNGCPPNYTIQGGVCKPYQGGDSNTREQQIINGIIGGVLQRMGR